MKKTRIMGLLLVFVLVTSCFAGGTFAKYTSQASGSDTANVAKWEIVYDDLVNPSNTTEIATDNVISFDLFNTVCELATTANDEQVADGATPLIAPGTMGKFNFTITNNSQVNARIDLDLSQNAHAIPIEYSLDGAHWYETFTEINAANDAIGLDYVGGSTTSTTITVYWRWTFDHTGRTNFAGKNDASDTDLGVEAQTTAPSVTVTAVLRATQVD